MTISSPDAVVVVQANGTTINFNFNFLIPYQADGVTPASAVQTIDPNDNYTTVSLGSSNGEYQISGVGVSSGGFVTLVQADGTPFPSGWRIVIERDLSYIQPTSVNNFTFFPHTIEAIADNLEAQIQQLAQELIQAPLFPPGDTTNYVFPGKSLRAGLLLGFDALGNPTLVPGTAGPPIPPFGLNMVNLLQYGAKGDGVTDDAPALRSAMAAAVSLGWPLFIPPAPVAYLLGSTVTGYSSLPAFCTVPTGVDIVIFGLGKQSVFTIANGFSTSGNYNYFVSADGNAHGKIEVFGIRINGNGANNLVVDSGAHLRSAYGFKLSNGDELFIHHCIFHSMPGRNVLNLSASASSPDWNTSRIQDNLVYDVGGAIQGNENQNDHSSFYISSARSLVSGNVLYNTYTNFSPNAAPQHTVSAIEEHSSHSDVIGNVVYNYGAAAIPAAALFTVQAQSWVGNHFIGMKSLIMNINTLFKMERLNVLDNVFENDNTTVTSAGGLFQNTSTGVTAVGLGQIAVRGNNFYCLNQSAQAVVGNGIFLCAADYIDIQDNTFSWWQGSAIKFLNHAGTLGISGALIDYNRFRSNDIGSLLTDVFAVYIKQPDSNKIFRDITIGANNFITADLQAVGVAPLPSRGHRIEGPGNLANVLVYTPNVTDGSIQRGQRVAFVSGTNNINVVQVPRTIMLAHASSPVSGYFDVNGETVVHSDPISGGFFGRIVSTAGSANGATWAMTTAYMVGQWVVLSTNKTLECTVSGTSGGSEPTPTVPGEQYSDGTVTWVYRDSIIAAFKTYGVIS